MKVKRVSVAVTERLWLAWKIAAAREGVSMKELAVREIERHLGKKEKP